MWLFPLTYALHIVEEYVAAGGFVGWAQRSLGIHLSEAEFAGWNACGLAMTSVGTYLVQRDAKFRFVEITLAVAVLGNAAGHAMASAFTATYSPGLITGIVLWVPLGAFSLRRATRIASPRGRRAGVYLGFAVVLVTFAILAAARLAP